MKVWWCEEHQEAELGLDRQCWSGLCRMVEMQLVPADARMVSGNAVVIEKENGEWPEEVIDKAASAFDNSDRVARRLAIACLDALSVSDPTKTEPPKDPWDYDP